MKAILENHVHYRQHEDRDRHNEEEVVRTAPRVQAGVLHRVRGVELILRLVAGDGFMLRAVIHEDAAHILYARNGEQIAHVDAHAQKTLHERAPNALALAEDKRRDKLRQEHEQPHRKQDAEHRRHADHYAFNALAEGFCEPFLEF